MTALIENQKDNLPLTGYRFVVPIVFDGLRPSVHSSDPDFYQKTLNFFRDHLSAAIRFLAFLDKNVKILMKRGKIRVYLIRKFQYLNVRVMRLMPRH